MIAFNLKDIYAAKQLAKYCEQYNYEIDAIYGRYTVDAKSIMGLIDLIGHTIELKLYCNHDDESSFIKDIKNIQGGV